MVFDLEEQKLYVYNISQSLYCQNVEATDDGGTPLLMASQEGNVDLVKVLIAAGGNVNQADTSNGSTPLRIASQNGHIQVVELLLSTSNIDINQHNHKNITSLEFG